jgi:integrase
MINKLDVKTIKRYIAKGTVKKYSDGGGLNLVINKSGSVHWRLSYRMYGKQKTITLGHYPILTLAQARIKRNDIKAKIRQGIDPIRKKDKGNSFKEIAQQWFDTNLAITNNKGLPKWSDKHAKRIWKSLEDNIFNHIGHYPISSIDSVKLTEVLKVIEARGSLEHLKKIRVRCSNVFVYARVKGLITINPAQDLETILQSPTPKNFNSIQLKDLPDLIKDIESYDGEPTTKAGLKIALHTFLRTNEIRYSKWNEIDFENKLWIISADRMKMKRSHIIPMSKAVIKILKQLEPYTGQYEYIFASTHKPHEKPFSENAMLYALYRLKWQGRHTVHGFRHLASTTLRELGYDGHLVEKQLSHESKNKIESTYNKAEYLADRTKMMNDWSSFIENCNGKIIPINTK